MARYDVFALDGGLVLDLQADIIIIPGSRVVAPLIPEAVAPQMTPMLHPRVIFMDAPYVIATHLLAATPEAALKSPVGDLAEYADAITRSLDTLFQGF